MAETETQKDRRQLFNEKMRHGELVVFLNNMMETYYEHKDVHSGPIAIYKALVNFIEKIRRDNSLFNDMESTVNLLGDNLITRFREQCPELKIRDIKLFTYIVIRFSPISIGVVLGKTPEQIYRMKYKLKHKIMDSSASDKEIFLKYMK